jgi:pantoate kinase
LSTERLGLATRFAKKQGLMAAEVDGETALLSVDEGAYFAIDSVGSRVWELIDGERSLAEICELLVTEYDVSLEECQGDVLGFAEYLEKAGLVNCQDSRTGGS